MHVQKKKKTTNYGAFICYSCDAIHHFQNPCGLYCHLLLRNREEAEQSIEIRMVEEGCSPPHPFGNPLKTPTFTLSIAH